MSPFNNVCRFHTRLAMGLAADHTNSFMISSVRRRVIPHSRLMPGVDDPVRSSCGSPVGYPAACPTNLRQEIHGIPTSAVSSRPVRLVSNKFNESLLESITIPSLDGAGIGTSYSPYSSPYCAAKSRDQGPMIGFRSRGGSIRVRAGTAGRGDGPSRAARPAVRRNRPGQRPHPVRQDRPGPGEKLGRVDVAQRVGREIAEEPGAPVAILQAAFGLIRGRDPKVAVLSFQAAGRRDCSSSRAGPAPARSGR